jgi:outer membrane protein OmpA-like peptidoglycan-associated protein
MIGLGVCFGVLWGPAMGRAFAADPSPSEQPPSPDSNMGTGTDTGSGSQAAPSGQAGDDHVPQQGENIPAGAHCMDSGVTLTFDTNSARINGRGRTSLNGVAKWLLADEKRSVEVNGYTDDTGGAALNQKLSEKRAEAVKSYLVARGVEAGRIDTTGHGMSSDRPADLDNTRAVAVTVCEAGGEAAAPPAPAEPPPAPLPPPPSTTTSTYQSKTVVMVPPPAPPPPAPKQEGPASKFGLGLLAGGGATGFWEQGANTFADNGGMWDVRAVFGTRLPFAFEASYIGTAQGVSALGLDNNAVLVGNGGEGTLRFNIVRGRVQPYLFGGGGWTRYRITNTAINTASLSRSDDVVVIPVGAGVTGRIGKGFLLDVRGTGRLTFQDTLFNNIAASTNAGNSSLNSWGAMGNLGYEF